MFFYRKDFLYVFFEYIFLKIILWRWGLKNATFSITKHHKSLDMNFISIKKHETFRDTAHTIHTLHGTSKGRTCGGWYSGACNQGAWNRLYTLYSMLAEKIVQPTIRATLSPNNQLPAGSKQPAGSTECQPAQPKDDMKHACELPADWSHHTPHYLNGHEELHDEHC